MRSFRTYFNSKFIWYQHTMFLLQGCALLNSILMQPTLFTHELRIGLMISFEFYKSHLSLVPFIVINILCGCRFPKFHSCFAVPLLCAMLQKQHHDIVSDQHIIYIYISLSLYIYIYIPLNVFLKRNSEVQSVWNVLIRSNT